jgi:hypothetical protein
MPDIATGAKGAISQQRRREKPARPRSGHPQRSRCAARMVKLYGFARVNQGAHGKTRDLRVLWTLEEVGMAYGSSGWTTRTTHSIPLNTAR